MRFESDQRYVRRADYHNDEGAYDGVDAAAESESAEDEHNVHSKTSVLSMLSTVVEVGRIDFVDKYLQMDDAELVWTDKNVEAMEGFEDDPSEDLVRSYSSNGFDSQ